MNTPIQNALLITAIGMGLVFIAIILLWGMMELIVKSTAGKPIPNEQSSEPQENTESPQPAPQTDQLARRKAAAAAVAFAIAAERATVPSHTAPPYENISTWQAVMRAGNLNQISNFQRRNPRGSRQ